MATGSHPRQAPTSASQGHGQGTSRAQPCSCKQGLKAFGRRECTMQDGAAEEAVFVVLRPSEYFYSGGLFQSSLAKDHYLPIEEVAKKVIPCHLRAAQRGFATPHPIYWLLSRHGVLQGRHNRDHKIRSCTPRMTISASSSDTKAFRGPIWALCTAHHHRQPRS